jgi:anti-sigma regulatory factor (Ser/Thr protein kinase)
MEKRILIRRWLGSETQFIPIYDEASVSSARQRVRDAGQPLNLSKELGESVALIASELTHNHLRHAKQGYFAVRPIEHGGQKGLEVIAADLGPGIDKPFAAIRSQMPKEAGSLGAGIAAVCRLADEVAWDNRLSEGVCIIARKFETAAASLCEAAIMSRPYPGEPISGDDAIIIQSEAGFLAAVSDGLGHGPEAREASNRAIEVVSKSTQDDLDQIAIRINQELAGTRGCAISLYHLRDAHFFTPTPMVLGTGQLRAQKLRIERTEVKPNSVLVMFTDGLKSRTTLKGELDVLRQPAIVIAQHLLDTHSRPDDDALVCVVRFTR